MDKSNNSEQMRFGFVLGEPAPLYAHFHIPHPLDFDWRFTESTTTSLWQLAHVLAESAERIVLLGTPSLAKRATEDRVWNGPVLLFDKNAAGFQKATGAVEAIEFDILHNVPSGPSAALVFADPPWYEDEMKSFLWCSAAFCRVGGHIAMSIPPPDTRPGISEERVRIEQAANAFGLRLVRIIPSALRYETPFFEANAMRAAGTPQSHDWRRGDLALYIREGHFLGKRPEFSIADLWTERTIGSTRIRLKGGPSLGFGNPVMCTIVPGNILPSVSRRDPRRTHVNVWTSGNRVFRCSGTGVLLEILDAIVEQKDFEKSIALRLGQSLSQAERFRIHLATNQLLNVVKCESGELRAFMSSIRAHRKLGPGPHSAIARQRAG